MPLSMYDRGMAAFISTRNVAQPIVNYYPTQDKHSPHDEAEFIRGWYDGEKWSQLSMDFEG